MKTEALLEFLPGHRFRVTGSGRFMVSGEGTTPDEAIAAFQQAARSAQVITVELDDMDTRSLYPQRGIDDEASEDTWSDFLDEIQRQRAEDNDHH